MSTKTAKESNALIKDSQMISGYMRDLGFLERLEKIKINWRQKEIKIESNSVKKIFKDSGYVVGDDKKFNLTDKGLLMLGRVLLDFEELVEKERVIDDKYVINKVLRQGKNSVTYLATHQLFNRKFVLKLIRPGASEDIISSLKVLGSVKDNQYLVQPLDLIYVEVNDVFGTNVLVPCIIFPYVHGKTLGEFLNDQTPLSPYFFVAFIQQVGSALASLEDANVYHGDLHDENIIVNTDSPEKIEFKIIDISYGIIGSQNEHYYATSDFDQFKYHLWRSMTTLQKHLPRMSIKKHLGAKVYFLIKSILDANKLCFQDVLLLVKNNALHNEFAEKRSQFIEKKFRKPRGIGLHRYEEITNPSVAVSLFEPYPDLLENLKKFGNSMLCGHRGSGKSTYLASLAYFPDVAEPTVDPRSIFGVFFPCRQGEFKQFSEEVIDYNSSTNLRLKHIFILKVFRRVVHSLSEGVKAGKLREPVDYSLLYGYLNTYIHGGSVHSYDVSIVSPLENLHAGLLRNEMREIDNLFIVKKTSEISTKTAKENELIEFFKCVKDSFHELVDTQFYLLFDDAGHPNIPYDAQKIINDLIISSNPLYCVKLSSERYSYKFIDTRDKPLEDGHDYVGYDISRTLFIGSGGSTERPDLEKYFRRIVDRRLAQKSYQSTDIREYLGDGLIKGNELASRLVENRKNAYYCGWDIIWQLSDRTTRNLLELVSEIFTAGEINENSKPQIIKPHIQNKVIRRVSEQRLKALGYIPGTIVRGKTTYSLGRKLFEFAITLGSIYRAYLRSGKTKRAREILAIERNEFSELSDDAQNFLNYLIQYGILDDTKLEISRDDQLKKPIYILNRIFCPVFGISYRRDQHLRLSKQKFEQLLLDPSRFKYEGTKVLKDLSQYRNNYSMDLFEDLLK
ncbi:MAG: protein kinase [Candidatus Thiodiazotropha sp. (ex Codakia orbicularis)]|nr:protein kinase [Candidatus Thiodiazotropha sp. (ex Codakia orbicularis)]